MEHKDKHKYISTTLITIRINILKSVFGYGIGFAIICDGFLREGTFNSDNVSTLVQQKKETVYFAASTIAAITETTIREGGIEFGSSVPVYQHQQQQ